MVRLDHVFIHLIVYIYHTTSHDLDATNAIYKFRQGKRPTACKFERRESFVKAVRRLSFVFFRWLN